MAEDVISRDLIEGKLKRMQDRVKQRRDGSYKCGYNDACNDALQKVNECPSADTTSITYCKDCIHASDRETTMPFCIIQNRRKMPESYCENGAHDY